MARKKFEAQSIESGTGLVKQRHEVRTRGGALVELTARPMSVRKGERNYELGDAKRRILNRLPVQDGRVRTVILEGMAKAERVFKSADRSRDKRTGELRPPEQVRVTQEVGQVVSETVRELRDAVVDNLERSVKTYLIGVRRSLPDKDQLPMAMINEIASRKAREVYRARTGKNQMSTPMRLSALGARMESELLKHLNVGMLDRLKRERVLKKALVDPKGSNIACVAKGVSRINRTEQNRAMHEAVVELAQSIGISLFYWRLSAAHKSYGGREICEVLSVSTGYDVEELLPTGFSGSLNGLYSANSLPDIPHPNCMCSIEPVVV